MLSDNLAGENYGLPTDYDNLDWDFAARQQRGKRDREQTKKVVR